MHMAQKKWKVYEYSGCGTCRKALQYLEKKDVSYEKLPIRETPPSLTELKAAKQYLGDIKRLFNTSGKDYKEGNWKEKVLSSSEGELLKALSVNGNLVKRPFVVGDGWFLVGFKEDEWKNKT